MPTTAIQKLKKILSPETLDELDAMSKDDLRATIVRCEGNIKVSEEERATNEHLQAAKAALKELDGPFRDAIKYQRAKQRYASLRLEEVGAVDA